MLLNLVSTIQHPVFYLNSQRFWSFESIVMVSSSQTKKETLHHRATAQDGNQQQRMAILKE